MGIKDLLGETNNAGRMVNATDVSIEDEERESWSVGHYFLRQQA
tara:strand:+ start:317 stop:448 length:132 start_codon:yes stop_codon:yes gene_type:complete